MLSHTKKGNLVVLLGPTGVGKTALSIELAKQLNAPIVSSDSRQIYKEFRIGTASPTPEQLAQVQHFLVGTKSITEYYNAYEFEQEVLQLLANLFTQHNNVILSGGSQMYIDAICKGIDETPTIDTELREDIRQRWETEGIDALRRELKILDPEYYATADIQNPKRVIHALEVCIMAGKPYSSLRTKTIKERSFNIVKVGLNIPREELFQRINARVDAMMADGMEEEARNLLPFRNLNALNTIGYKEMFDYFDGIITFEKAIELIKRNSRRYAKKQLTWFLKDEQIRWFHPNQQKEVIAWVNSELL